MKAGRLIATSLTAMAAVAAQAAIVITAGPGNWPNDENVLFNEEGLIASGPLVQGITNQSNFIVDFYDAGEDLVTPPGGQARVEAVDGAFTDLKLQLDQPGATFDTLIWNLNAKANGNVTFTIERTGGPNHVESFALDRAGENWFRFEAIGESMISARLHTDVELQDVRQVRLGNVVPEPATITALLLGAAGFFARRKRKP